LLRPALLSAVLAGCAAPAPHPDSAANACDPHVSVRTFPDGEPLAEMPLAGDGRFALTFIQSVSLTPVRDEYVLTSDGAIRQTAEIFIAHGQGLPSAADEPGGLAWEHEDGRFRLTMDRPIPRLVVRANARYENRLHADGRTLDLTQWTNRALELHPEICPRPRRPAAGR
jgi:hypothetical protein